MWFTLPRRHLLSRREPLQFAGIAPIALVNTDKELAPITAGFRAGYDLFGISGRWPLYRPVLKNKAASVRIDSELPTNHPGIVGCDAPLMDGEIPVSYNLILGYRMTRYTSAWPESFEARRSTTTSRDRIECSAGTLPGCYPWPAMRSPKGHSANQTPRGCLWPGTCSSMASSRLRERVDI
jgi:hypothetical protein